MSLSFGFTVENIILAGRTSKSNVEIIKSWLKSCENDVPHVLPDELLVLFLLACRNDVKLTKTTITTHYKLKTQCCELHQNRQAECEKVKAVLDLWNVAILPARTDENCAIHYFKLNDSDYKKFDLTTMLKVTLMLIDVSLNNDPPDGIIVVADIGAGTLMHITKLKLDLIMKYFQFIQEGIFSKFTAIHMVNSNFVIKKIFSIVRTCIKSDFFQKIYFHSPDMNWEQFYHYLPQKCLPKDFGGDLDPLNELSAKTHRQFKNLQEFWNLEEQLWKK